LKAEKKENKRRSDSDAGRVRMTTPVEVARVQGTKPLWCAAILLNNSGFSAVLQPLGAHPRPARDYIRTDKSEPWVTCDNQQPTLGRMFDIEFGVVFVILQGCRSSFFFFFIATLFFPHFGSCRRSRHLCLQFVSFFRCVRFAFFSSTLQNSFNKLDLSPGLKLQHAQDSSRYPPFFCNP
jgi:hypothetical protein